MGPSNEKERPNRTSSRIIRAARDALGGHLPLRYSESWEDPFYQRIEDGLFPGARVLDVGSGSSPTIPVHKRPAQCHYVGLDIDKSELDKAPRGSYNQVIVTDLVESLPELKESFDLVVSQFVFEHVKPLDRVLLNLRGYLKPGGLLVSHLSGGFSVFAVLNRLMPSRAAIAFLRIVGRNPATVFKAYYDKCSFTALNEILGAWTKHEVLPRYLGAGYFRFSHILQAIYLAFEEWTIATNRRNLASYYLISAEK